MHKLSFVCFQKDPFQTLSAVQELLQQLPILNTKLVQEKHVRKKMKIGCAVRRGLFRTRLANPGWLKKIRIRIKILGIKNDLNHAQPALVIVNILQEFARKLATVLCKLHTYISHCACSVVNFHIMLNMFI